MRISIFTIILVFVQSSKSYMTAEDFFDQVYFPNVYGIPNTSRPMSNTSLVRFEAHCPGSREKLLQSLKQRDECFNEMDQSLTICKMVEDYIIKCHAPFLKVAEDCLAAEWKNTPRLILKSMVSAGNYLCKLDGKDIIELLNTRIYKDVVDMRVGCMNDAMKKIERYYEKTPTKEEICVYLADMVRPCFMNHLNKCCPNPKTKEATTGLFNAVLKPCTTLSDA